MPIDCSKLCLLFALATLPALSTAEKLYRWVDEDGNVHFSDKIPPDSVKQERTILDKRGMAIDTVDAAKTPEEIAREAELDRLRKEKERLIEERRAADMVLLRTFRSVDDMVLARDGKIAAIDLLIQVAESNIRQLKNKLNNMQEQAAGLERAGQPVPKNLRESIDAARSSLRDTYAAILRHEDAKTEIRTKYNADIERFQTLKHLSEERQVETEEEVNVELPNVHRCADEASCERSWKLARSFAEESATTPVEFVSDHLIMTSPPTRDNDINITIARIPEKDGLGAQLFLDVQCRNTQQGQEFCAGPRVQLLEKRFRTYLVFGIQ